MPLQYVLDRVKQTHVVLRTPRILIFIARSQVAKAVNVALAAHYGEDENVE